MTQKRLDQICLRAGDRLASMPDAFHTACLVSVVTLGKAGLASDAGDKRAAREWKKLFAVTNKLIKRLTPTTLANP